MKRHRKSRLARFWDGFAQAAEEIIDAVFNIGRIG